MSAKGIVASDEFFDLACHPCDNEGEHREAKGFCKHCQEYLCSTCITYHGKVSATKGHKILNQVEMTKMKVAPIPREALIEVCPYHDREVIKFFCSIHDKLGCSVCLSLDHKACKGVAYIPDVSSGVKDGPELKQVQTNLHRLLDKTAEYQDKVNEIAKKVISAHDTVVADIRGVRKEINKCLDNLEEVLLSQVTGIKTRDEEKITGLIGKFQGWIADIGSMLSDFNEKEKRNKNNGLFVAMKKAKVQISAMEEKVGKAGDIRMEEYSFEKTKVIQGVTTTLCKLWQLDVHRDTKTDIDLDVKSVHDTGDCYIGGIVALPCNRLALTDIDNKSVKVIDVDQNKITAEIHVSSSPFDLALVKENQLAVTLGQEKKIQMLSVSNTLKTEKTFSVSGTCKGIDSREGKLFVVCQNPDAILVLNLNGKLLQKIDTYTFSMPTRIGLSQDGGEMYVTDHKGEKMICLTRDGEVLSVFQHAQLSRPLGLAVNSDDGSVYICSWGLSNIHHLTSSGELKQILLTENDGIRNPVAVAHKDSTLFISFDSLSTTPNKVKVIKLK